MAIGYTRQSVFIDGDVILAEHGNLEFDKLVNVFSETLGHSHDGTAAGGAAVPLLKSPDGLQTLNLTVNGIEGNVIKDEDAMTSNSQYHIPTQQSTKAYADYILAQANVYTDGEVAAVVLDATTGVRQYLLNPADGIITRQAFYTDIDYTEGPHSLTIDSETFNIGDTLTITKMSDTLGVLTFTLDEGVFVYNGADITATITMSNLKMKAELKKNSSTEWLVTLQEI